MVDVRTSLSNIGKVPCYCLVTNTAQNFSCLRWIWNFYFPFHVGSDVHFVMYAVFGLHPGLIWLFKAFLAEKYTAPLFTNVQKGGKSLYTLHTYAGKSPVTQHLSSFQSSPETVLTQSTTDDYHLHAQWYTAWVVYRFIMWTLVR